MSQEDIPPPPESQTRRRKVGQPTEGRGTTDLNGNIKVQIDDENDEDGSEKENTKKVKIASGVFTFLSVTILLSIIILFVKYMDTSLPKPFQESDIPSNPSSFIEGRARKDLYDLTKRGPRVTGTNLTDIITVGMFLDVLRDIQSSALQDVQFVVQRPSGTFWLDDDEGYSYSYSKIPNVVAKLEPKDEALRSGHGVLLNCHFDTKPGCVGATDNMISCSVMLEVLRVLASSSEPLMNSIVFLFNGAEELKLQGSHGLVAGKEDHLAPYKGHPWAQNLQVFLNLEGAGAGGREILFQSTGGDKGHTGWLLKAYRQGPHPYTTVLGEEAYQAGLVPSDTDFRIFRDYGGLAGMDIAFIKNGWVYHTQWDRLSEIPAGSIQNMGDNALAMTRYLGELDFEKLEDSSEKMVFFDVLGTFIVSYSRTVGIVINVFVGVASLGAIGYHVGRRPWSKLLKFPIYLGTTLLAWGLGIGVAALVAVILDSAGYPKPFYSYPSLAIVLYGLPAFCTQILVFSVLLKGSVEDAWMAGKLTTAVLLLVATGITRGAYIFAIPLIFGLVGWLVSKYLVRGWPRSILVTYLLIGELIPLILSSYLVVTFTDIFVPMMGRSGSGLSGNLYFGLIASALVSILVIPGLVALFVHYDKTVLITCLLGSVFLLNPMLVFGFMGRIPYQEKTPMRLTICEVERILHDFPANVHDPPVILKSEKGYWWWPLDGDTRAMFSTFEEIVPHMASVVDEVLDYETCETLYCGQPFIWPTTKRISTSYWIPTNGSLPPLVRDQVGMRILQNTTRSPSERRLTLEFWGPPQTTLVLSPRVGWDAVIKLQVLMDNIPLEREGERRWQERKVYWLYHGRGYEEEPFRVNVDLTRNGDVEGQGSLMEIALSGLFVDMREETTTPEYRHWLSHFPSWTFTGMSWSSVMKMYKIL